MFGKAKGSSREKDEPLPPAPQLQDLTPANLAESDSTEISCIGPGMTVVGKISSEGTLDVFGRVEGELHASIVRISGGGQVEGAIAAQDLTIGGRFKGTIQANRVTLTSSAVVEGEIHHRSLAIEENAWFEIWPSQIRRKSAGVKSCNCGAGGKGSSFSRELPLALPNI
jgi:cytoskeletal protein CcmA (bactofilin family)